MTRSIPDELNLHGSLLSALARRGRERRLARELADAELEEGLWVDAELGAVRATLPRMAADSGTPGRYATDPPLELPGGQRVMVTLEPTTEGAWIASARRLLASPAAPRPAIVVRLSSADGASARRLLLSEGEELVADLFAWDPGGAPSIDAYIDIV